MVLFCKVSPRIYSLAYQTGINGALGILSRRNAPARFASLTTRERQVLPLVVSGLPNKLIAAELGISEAVIKVHRSQLMRKMRADSLPDLVRMAGKIGFPARSNPEN